MSHEQKKYKISLNDNAKRMLRSHVRFVANVSPAAARKLAHTLNSEVQSLKSLPHRCPKFRASKANKAYHKLTVGRYQVIFSIDESSDTVNVEYILDSRQSNEI